MMPAGRIQGRKPTDTTAETRYVRLSIQSPVLRADERLPSLKCRLLNLQLRAMLASEGSMTGNGALLRSVSADRDGGGAVPDSPRDRLLPSTVQRASPSKPSADAPAVQPTAAKWGPLHLGIMHMCTPCNAHAATLATDTHLAQEQHLKERTQQ